MTVSITPTGVQYLKLEGVTGSNGAGACTATGAQVGDLVMFIAETSGTYKDVPAGGDFEGVISVADQIQQKIAVDFSGQTFNAVLVRGLLPW